MDLATWTCVLGLTDLEVVEAQRDESGKGWRLAVVPTASVTLCPFCNRATGSRHMVRWQPIHDLPLAGQPLRLNVQTVEFACKPCGRTFTVHPPCVLEGTHATIRLAESLTDCVNVSTLAAASATYHVPETTVKSIFERLVEQRRAQKEQTLMPVTKLGIDEIHLELREQPAPPPVPASVEPSRTTEKPNPKAGGKISRGGSR